LDLRKDISGQCQRKYTCERDLEHTNFSCNIAVQAREDQVAVLKLLRNALLYDQVSNALREWQRLLPLDGIFVLFSRGALRGSDCVKHKVWVQRKQEDEALANRARGTEHTCD
jgi:hypothetical protein